LFVGFFQLLGFGENQFINYIYDPQGRKLRKWVYSNKDLNEYSYFDYCGQFVYKTNCELLGNNRSLIYILTPEGRIVNSGTTEAPVWKWEYNLTDHLGNVRAVITPHEIRPGYATVLQEINYFPFGMLERSENPALAGRISQMYASSGTDNRYLFNSKELQDDFGLNWYDFGARFYDPASVRTPTPDPHSGNYYSESPYSFLGNNPISNVDPTGMDWYSYTDDKGNVHYKYQDGRDEIEGYTNIGSSVNIKFGEGFYYNAFQNYGFTTIDAPADAKAKILGSATLQDKLLSDGSGFSAQGQAEIMAGLINQGKSDFINHPATQAALSGLLFVATGGIEGAASLLNAGRSLLAKGASGAATKTSTSLPMQVHHFATNKSKTFTPRMAEIADEFGLSLNGAWNKQALSHLGRHPNNYHNFVLEGMKNAKAGAGGSQVEFLNLFNQYVKQPVIQNPGLLRKSGW